MLGMRTFLAASGRQVQISKIWPSHVQQANLGRLVWAHKVRPSGLAMTILPPRLRQKHATTTRAPSKLCVGRRCRVQSLQENRCTSAPGSWVCDPTLASCPRSAWQPGSAQRRCHGRREIACAAFDCAGYGPATWRRSFAALPW
eukprot:357811-Chlamydomonas_euryale.AAC.7